MPPEAMLGFDTADDAAVWRIAPNIAGILTIDFLTPIVDEPYDFGRIAAANALSDVFAMGGVPNVALNVVAMDSALPEYVPRDMLRGGLEKVIEAGAVIMGGHSIDDEEPKYGLCVFGTVAPDALVRNEGAKPGVPVPHQAARHGHRERGAPRSAFWTMPRSRQSSNRWPNSTALRARRWSPPACMPRPT